MDLLKSKHIILINQHESHMPPNILALAFWLCIKAPIFSGLIKDSSLAFRITSYGELIKKSRNNPTFFINV